MRSRPALGCIGSKITTYDKGVKKLAKLSYISFQIYDSYEEKGFKVWLIKPAIDIRDDKAGKHIIRSRIGLESEADIVGGSDNLVDWLDEIMFKQTIDVIICDECQFLTEKHVNQLRHIASFSDIPVFCFGLRSDFTTHLFEGSKRLFEIADSISEIKSICKCGNKAIVNVRIDSKGKIITEGEQIELGGNEKYVPLCWKCYKKKQLENAFLLKR